MSEELQDRLEHVRSDYETREEEWREREWLRRWLVNEPPEYWYVDEEDEGE